MVLSALAIWLDASALSKLLRQFVTIADPERGGRYEGVLVRDVLRSAYFVSRPATHR